MTRFKLILPFLFISFFVQSQVRLEGVVRDNLGLPLEMANVMAVNEETKAMDAYAITNGVGRYYLNLKPNSKYSIKVSFLGFQTLNVSIETESQNISRDFNLEEGGIMLDAVEIVHEMPVSIKGDTIIYNADSFKTGTEQKLEDVFKKLPGFEVTEDGEVEVEGKRVSQMLVEGKKFFEGDTKLGSKNIPADAVDKVQVLRNFSEVGQLRGLENNSDEIAINIKLKEGKKNFWFGDISAGVGPDERYIVNPKIFYYSPSTSVNVLSNFNNIGDVPFSLRDYFRLTGGSRNTISRSGTNFNIASNDLGISTQRNNRAAEIDNKFGALNLTQQITKSWNVSGFGILSSNKTLTNTESRNGYFRPESTEVETEENRSNISRVRNNVALFKFGSKYKPNTNFQLDYDAFVRRSNQSEDNGVISNSITYHTDGSFIENSNVINSFKKQDPISFNQSLNAFWTQNEKNTWVLELQHQYQDEDPFYNPDLQNDPFPFLGFEQNQSNFNINQERFVKTNKLDAKVDYYWSVTPKGILNVTLGNTNSYQNYNSSIYQLLDNGNHFELDDEAYKNDVRYSFNDFYLGAHYKFVIGKFTFNPGLSFHRYNTFNNQLDTKVKDDFSRILPDVFAQWQIKRSESLTYNYRMSNVFSDINSFVSGYTFNNFNAFNRGNRYLENALQQTHNLNYVKYNLFNFTTIVGNLNYSSTKDPIVNRTFFNGINQVSERVNADFENETVNAFGSFSRNFARFYKGTFSTNLNWSKYNTLRVNPTDPLNPGADIVQTTESFSQTYRLSFGTQFKELPNIEVGYFITLNDYQETTFKTQRPFARLDYYFLNGFSFTADYDFYHYSNSSGSVKNTYDFLNVGLNYKKKDAKMEYRINVTNLLNTGSLNDDSFSQTGFMTSQYFVMPRYAVFSLKYNL
ncbi:MAG: TonB-dependent receptor [Flavobacteriaceae bacterium]|jgi:hypothetical protein|nr:TonB-dependent receptor [Flavobacteriaceae bacterium]